MWASTSSVPAGSVVDVCRNVAVSGCYCESVSVMVCDIAVSSHVPACHGSAGMHVCESGRQPSLTSNYVIVGMIQILDLIFARAQRGL